MLKITVRFEIEEDVLKEMLESYEVKGTKKNITKLKKDILENDAGDDFAMNLSSDIENEIGEWIANMDWEEKELIND